MVKKIGISVSDWLFDEIEKRRGEKNRSEYVEEQIAISLGFTGEKNEKKNSDIDN